MAEIGRDMSRFPSAGHLVAWAGLCPGQNESPTGQARGLKAHGKRKAARRRKGAPWLKTLLVQYAWAAQQEQLSKRPVRKNKIPPGGAGDDDGGR